MVRLEGGFRLGQVVGARMGVWWGPGLGLSGKSVGVACGNTC